MTARDQIEYWRDKDAVVAKGNVVIVRSEKNTTIKSDEATAYFRDKTDDPATPEDETGDGSEVYQVEAQGHVRVDRKDQTAFSDHLAYNPETEIAILTGNVVIHSKDNTYNGARAELDLQKDISRLLPGARPAGLHHHQSEERRRQYRCRHAAGAGDAMMETGDQREEQVNGTTHPSARPSSSMARRSIRRGIEGLVAYHIGKQYRRRPVLRDVTIGVQRGEAVGLLGPNGAGKTTCFYIITGLIGADAGAIYLDGEDITDLPMYLRARGGIGYLPQESSIFRGMSVADNIMAVLEVTEPDKREREHRLEPPAGGFLDRPSAQARRRLLCRAASAGAWRSPAAWRPSRTTSCSTSRWPASIRSRSPTSATWCRTSRTAASAC